MQRNYDSIKISNFFFIFKDGRWELEDVKGVSCKGQRN